jgi:putative (di)nucleoside polyphosphate hydrolase
MLVRALSILVVLSQLFRVCESLLAPQNPDGAVLRSVSEVQLARGSTPEIGDKKPYRLGVVAVFVNEFGGVLICKKKGTEVWSFPQGGLEMGERYVERYEQALYREVLEEIGNNDFEIVRKSEKLITYDYHPLARATYKGQRQKWFLCSYKEGIEPALEQAADDVFDSYSWVSPEHAIEKAGDFKRANYVRGLSELGLVIVADGKPLNAREYESGVEKPYRMGVVAVFVNDSGKVLTCKTAKYDEWVFPQGGMEKGESFEQTLYREVLEEIGNNEFDIIRKADSLMSYDFRPTRRFEFRGQMQQWYLCRFKPGMGPDLDKALDAEFSSFSWVSPKQAVGEAMKVKKSRYQQGLSELGLVIDQ